MYLTFTEYQNMGGALDETTFNDYEFEARAKVDWYSFNRLQKETEQCEAVKRCMYHLISLIQLQRDALTSGSGVGSSSSTGGGLVASQSNDGVSVSYNTLSAKDLVDMIEPQIKKSISSYLQNVTNELGQKVLYRGLYPNE